MLQPGTILDNRYRIEATLGCGGFGYVYRARERLTGETVAIKELIPQLGSDPQMVQRFVQEARATLRLTHPHIARTYGLFEDGGTYYLAMEYLPGGSLAERLKQGPLPVDEALHVTAELCMALEYAHGQGVVHCDLKPANVLFDAQGGVRLADFGIAHVSEQLLTRHVLTGSGAIMGTVRYMAPEQLEGVRDDPRLDLYALGALVYEMLAGRPYLDFETETTPAAQMRNMQRIQSQPPRPLRAVNPAAPEWLAGVVEQALRKAPGERFATAGALREALRPRPVAPPSQALPRRSRPPTPAAEPKKCRPQRGLTGWQWVVGLVVLGLIAVGVYGLNLQQQANARATAMAQAIIAQAQATATAQARATATAQAQATATAQARSEVITTIFSHAQLVFGPESGSLEHKEDGNIERSRASVDLDLKNFIAEARFLNPYPTSTGSWDYGFLFRHAGWNDQYRLAIFSDKDWKLVNALPTGDDWQSTLIHQGTIANLNVAHPGYNTVRVIAIDTKGYLYINEAFIAELDLSARTASGDICVAIEIYKTDELNGYETVYQDFKVYKMP